MTLSQYAEFKNNKIVFYPAGSNKIQKKLYLIFVGRWVITEDGKNSGFRYRLRNKEFETLQSAIEHVKTTRIGQHFKIVRVINNATVKYAYPKLVREYYVCDHLQLIHCPECKTHFCHYCMEKKHPHKKITNKGIVLERCSLKKPVEVRIK